MKRKIQIRIAAGILLACAFYVAFYFHCRSSGLITHFASSHGQHDVRATDDPWSELARDMASSNTVLHAVVVAQTPSAKMLNTLFWPLRKIEVCALSAETASIDMYHEDAMTPPQRAPSGLLTQQQYTAPQLKGRRKSYINLWQPSGSQFCPVVATGSNGISYVSCIVPTESGRDIEVHIQNAAGWVPVGAQGHALTGGKQGYTFLGDMAIGRDGVVWVLAVFTLPGRTLLYSFAEGRWQLRGTFAGNTREGVNWDSGLHFVGNQETPCHIFQTSTDGFLVLHLNGTEWEHAPVEKTLVSHLKEEWVWPDNISKAKMETWFVWETDRKKPEKALKALAVTGIGEGDVIGPIEVEQVPDKHDLHKIAVSSTRVLAAAFRMPGGTAIRRCILAADGSSTVSAGPTIAGKAELADLKWSPDGVLYAAFKTSENKIELLRVDDDRFSVIATYLQPKKEGMIYDPHIYFDGKGEPVVVWADWFR